jgi:putative endonuclease
MAGSSPAMVEVVGGLDLPIRLSSTPGMPSGFVYILASKRNGTLYIGVTSNIPERIHAHREGHGSQFVKKYGVTRLVYMEEYPLYTDAIRRETNLKRWKRVWKLALIEKANPDWDDLTETWNA